MKPNTWIKLADIKYLQQSNVRIKNPENLEKKINDFRSGGFDKLQIVTDFDYTLTRKILKNGKTGPSSFCILEHCKSLPNDYKAKCDVITQKYKPIELDPSIAIVDKIDRMVEWWTLSSELLRYKLN